MGAIAYDAQGLLLALLGDRTIGNAEEGFNLNQWHAAKLLTLYSFCTSKLPKFGSYRVEKEISNLKLVIMDIIGGEDAVNLSIKICTCKNIENMSGELCKN